MKDWYRKTLLKMIEKIEDHLDTAYTRRVHDDLNVIPPIQAAQDELDKMRNLILREVNHD